MLGRSGRVLPCVLALALVVAAAPARAVSLEAHVEQLDRTTGRNQFTDRKSPVLSAFLHAVLPGSEYFYLNQDYTILTERHRREVHNLSDNVWFSLGSRFLTMGALYWLLTAPNNGSPIRDWRLALDISYWGSALVGPLMGLPLHTISAMSDADRYNRMAEKNEQYQAQRRIEQAEREARLAREQEEREARLARERELAKPEHPPRLTASIAFEDPHGKGVLLAEDSASLLLKVSNGGRGAAKQIKGTIKLKETVPGLAVPQSFDMGNLEPGQERTMRIPLAGARELPDGKATVEVTLVDAYENDAPLVRASFDTRPFKAPLLEVAQVGVMDGNNNGLIESGEQLDLQVVIRNAGEGYARDVRAKLLLQDPKITLLEEGTDVAETPVIPPGAWATAHYSILVRNLYAGPLELPLKVRLSEAHADLTATHPLRVVLNQPPVVVTMTATGLPDAATPQAALPDRRVDVDEVPTTESRRPNAIAAVIGIERYGKAPAVPFARRDATIFREYLVKTLGVPSENVLFLTDEQATLANIKTAIEGRLATMVETGQSEVFVYYAGHGAPDLDSKMPFLVPNDGDPAFPKTSCYSLETAYSALGKLGAKSVTVVLDSCFSGGVGRGTEAQTLIAGRPIDLDTNSAAVPQGVTVLAASSGNQLSSGFEAKQHGLFTYYLLKGIQSRADANGNGETTLSEIFEFLRPQVEREARRMNRTQVPVMIGPDAALLQGR